MESLEEDDILFYNRDTLTAVRENVDLHKPSRMEDAINILDAWVKKQSHFIKKDFRRSYLERTIIVSKGSLERAKARLDKICTLKTLMPKFFAKYDALKDFGYLREHLSFGMLPRMTSEHIRIFVVKYKKDGHSSEAFYDSYRLLVLLSEYLMAHDYCNGYVAVVDFRETDLLNLSSALSLVDLRQIMTITMEGYGMRIKGIILLTTSNAIDIVVGLMKQVMSKKLGSRISVHKTLESLHKDVPKELLPNDLGGDEKSVVELFDDWLNVMSTKKNKEYLKMMKQTSTIETKRLTANFNATYMGMPGSFRNLSVD